MKPKVKMCEMDNIVRYVCDGQDVRDVQDVWDVQAVRDLQDVGE